MVTQNKTWRFSKRIKMITIICGGRALRPRRSNIITPENSLVVLRERESFQE